VIALRVEDAYGAAVVIVPLAHERAAVVDVTPPTYAPTPGAYDLMLDADELRDLARIALMAADDLDRTDEVTS
jgi:hypothetical protein